MTDFKAVFKAQSGLVRKDTGYITVIIAAAICFVLIVCALSYNISFIKDRADEEKLLQRYREEAETLEKYLSIVEDPSLAQCPFDASEQAVQNAEQRLALIRFYIENSKTQYDYIDITDQSADALTDLGTFKTKRAMLSLFAVTAAGIVMFVYCFVTGVLRANRTFGKTRKTALLCDCGRRRLFWAGTATDICISAMLYFVVLAVSVIFMALSQSREYIIVYGQNIVTGSAFELLVARMTACIVAGMAAYSAGLLSGMGKNRFAAVATPIGAFVLLFCLSLVFANVFADIGLCRLVPCTGLTFNIRGFRDYALYINMIVTTVSAVVLLRKAYAVAVSSDY